MFEAFGLIGEGVLFDWFQWFSVVLGRVGRSIRRSVGQVVGQSGARSVSQSVSQPASQSVSESVSQPVSQPASQSISQSVSQAASQPVRQSVHGIVDIFLGHAFTNIDQSNVNIGPSIQ